MSDDTILYVELKTGFDNKGPAWIGRGRFSRTGGTLYFLGRVLKKAQSAAGNFLDAASGEAYWVSGVKQNEQNRLFGNQPVAVDAAVLVGYLQFIGRKTLPKAHYRVVEVLPTSTAYNHLQENQTL